MFWTKLHWMFIFIPMAGRRAHIGNDRFVEFFETIPEESRSQGYWRIKRESISESGVGGVVQAMLGFIPFNSQESYESLKGRIKDSFAVNKGPGTYYAIPCDDRKRELKDVDMVKVEFTEKEVPMPAPNGTTNGDNSSIGDPMKEVMDTMRKTMKDNAEMKAMKIREKMLSKMAGDDEDEEDDVRENASDLLGGGGLQNMLLYRQLFEGEKKKDSGDSEVKELLKEFMRSQQPKGDPEMKELLKELVRSQHQQKPAIDPEIKSLLEKLSHDKQAEKQESTLQTIFAMQLKQAEERDRVRDAEMKAREEERREERRQREEASKLEREKFEAQIKEREARFAAEMEIRRQEMRANESGGKHAMSEQQALQLKMFDFLSSNKNSSMDSMKTVVEMLTGAGLSSMKTAQTAAESILSIAQKAGRDDDDKDEKGSGVMDILKNLAPLAGSLLGPYANANAQQQLMQAMGGMPPGGLEALLSQLGGMGGMGGGPKPPPMQRQVPPTAPKMRPPVTEAPVPAPSAAPKASDKPDNGGMAMIIAKVLKDNPEIKHMMIGNMTEKMGVEMFVDFLYDFDIPGVDKMIAMMPPTVLMQFVKASCTPDEAKVIDANLQWFQDLKRVVLEEIKAEKEEEAEDDAQDKVVKDVAAGTAPTTVATPVPAPAPAPAPVALTPAPAPAAQV